MDSQWSSVLWAQMLHKGVEVLQAVCFACFSFLTPHPLISYILSELALEHSLVFLCRCNMRVYLEEWPNWLWTLGAMFWFHQLSPTVLTVVLNINCEGSIFFIHPPTDDDNWSPVANNWNWKNSKDKEFPNYLYDRCFLGCFFFFNAHFGKENDKFLDVTKCFLVIFENMRNIERIPNASSLAWPNRKCQRQLLCI